MDRESQISSFDGLQLDGLSYDQKILLHEYMSPHEGATYYAEHAQMMIDFLRHPEAFQANDSAKSIAFCDFVLRHFDDKHNAWPIQVKPSDIDWQRLRNVVVRVVYEYSSTAGRQCPVVIVEADARKSSKDNWEHFSNGGIAFALEDFVQKK